MNIYDFKAQTIENNEKDFNDYKSKVLLIVNTASKCGFTQQYKGLEELYKEFGNEHFEILGFPCDQFLYQEPGTEDEIKNFCEINYGVTFQLFKKIDVNGANAHPIFKYLSKNKSGLFGGAIKWNFTKFLIDSNGNVVERFAPATPPEKIKDNISKLIEEMEFYFVKNCKAS